jgi:pimeloyl-ACP methyl ester carboxylesterase
MKNQNWVFLRGLTRANIHWGDFPQIFQQINPEVKTQFLELPGNGEYFDLQTPTDPKAVVDFLRSKNSFSQTNQKFHLCGISLGGMIALKWAELYPDEVLSLAVINSSLRQCSPFYERMRANNYFNTIMTLLFDSAEEQECKLLMLTSNSFAKSEKFLSGFIQFAKTNPTSKINFVRQLVLANQIHIQGLPKIPVRIISSEKDRLVSAKCSEQICRNFHIQGIIHPTAGHDLPLDEPEWLANILLRKN